MVSVKVRAGQQRGPERDGHRSDPQEDAQRVVQDHDARDALQRAEDVAEVGAEQARRSLLDPLVVMFAIPFGIVGAAIGHLIMGYSLSLMSMMGIVALSGVVVNDAIVLIERVNENIAEGMSFFDAILSGGARRFRAIFLTSLSTVGGLTPLIMETDFQAKFLIPMAISIAAGMAFATG